MSLYGAYREAKKICRGICAGPERHEGLQGCV
uniref:Uncharacterized protein n=1 Tax=Siphoviridae sp. ctq1q8 TaxID=2826467 RepID=A0A8S5MFJ6_9CAUD|nr:MAG TPA: hypothetical protein [Siphoviridae sp. ctq1q8]